MDVVRACPQRHRLRGGDARHGDDRRPPEPPVSADGQRRVLPSTATVPARRRRGARSKTRCRRFAKAGRFASCSCPTGHDPDSFVNEHSVSSDAFVEALDQGTSRCRNFLIERAGQPGRHETVDGKARSPSWPNRWSAGCRPGVYRELCWSTASPSEWAWSRSAGTRENDGQRRKPEKPAAGDRVAGRIAGDQAGSGRPVGRAPSDDAALNDPEAGKRSSISSGNWPVCSDPASILLHEAY